MKSASLTAKFATFFLTLASVAQSQASSTAQSGSTTSGTASVATQPELPQDPFPIPLGDAHDMGNRSVLPAAIYFDPGSGLSVQSEDNAFKLTTGLRAQFLYSLEHDANANGPHTTQSFSIRRARLKFGGHVFGEDNKFKTEFAFSEQDLGVESTLGGRAPQTSPILDWYMDFTQLRDLQLRVGQYKVPFSRQRVISSGDLQLVDRSIVNSELNLDRDIGMDLHSPDLGGLGLLRYHLGIYTGEGRNSNHAADFGMFYLARLEVLPMGDFEDYEEADFERPLVPKLSVGAAYAYLDRATYERGTLGPIPADGGSTDIHAFTVDGHFKFAGFSALSETILRSGQRNPGARTVLDDTGEQIEIPVAPANDGYGTMLQLGYLLPRTRLEIAGRAAFLWKLGAASPVTNQTELGGGLSYYFARHAFKLQADYFLLREEGLDAGDTHLARIQLQTSL